MLTVLLYDGPVSGNCYKVRLLVAHLAIAYERRTIDVVDRSNRREVLGGLNPSLRVPTHVLDDGRPLAESGAILWYFGEGTRFASADRYERAQVLQWMFFEQYEHEPAIAVLRFWLAYSGCPKAFAHRVEETTAAGRRVLRTTLAASRSTHTRTSPTRRASSSTSIRRCRRGSRASTPSPATFRSTREGASARDAKSRRERRRERRGRMPAKKTEPKAKKTATSTRGMRFQLSPIWPPRMCSTRPIAMTAPITSSAIASSGRRRTDGQA